MLGGQHRDRGRGTSAMQPHKKGCPSVLQKSLVAAGGCLNCIEKREGENPGGCNMHHGVQIPEKSVSSQKRPRGWDA